MFNKIKKIKNVRYSLSKSRAAILWLEATVKRNRLLSESDWTQLPDANLTVKSKNEWEIWRAAVRNLKRSEITNIDEFNNELHSLELDMRNIPIAYTDKFENVGSGKKYLHELLLSAYNHKIITNFPASLDVKYGEVLDILSKFFSYARISNSIDIPSLIATVKLVDIDIDISEFKFFKLDMELSGNNIRENIINILTEKQKYIDFMLNEEYMLLHFERLITSCATPKDIRTIKMQIELNYK